MYSVYHHPNWSLGELKFFLSTDQAVKPPALALAEEEEERRREVARGREASTVEKPNTTHEPPRDTRVNLPAKCHFVMSLQPDPSRLNRPPVCQLLSLEFAHHRTGSGRMSWFACTHLSSVTSSKSLLGVCRYFINLLPDLQFANARPFHSRERLLVGRCCRNRHRRLAEHFDVGSTGARRRDVLLV